MYGLTDIANAALLLVPTNSTIASIDEDSNEADVFLTQYPLSRDMTLAAQDWNFARRTVPLALLSLTVPNWQYVYAVPDRCIKFRAILPSFQVDTTAGGLATPAGSFPGRWQDGLPAGDNQTPVPYDLGVALDAQGHEIKVILTNQANAYGVYTLQLLDQSLFTPEFVNALSYHLAARMGPSLGADAGTIQRNLQLWDRATAEAKALEANETSQIQNTTPDWGLQTNR